MRRFILFSAIFAFSLTSEIQTNGLEFDLDKELVDNFLVEYEDILRSNDVGEITAICNEYADKLFINVERYALSHGLDPVKMDNISENFLGSSITLTEGLLHGISTISRYDDVKLTYQHSLKNLKMVFPILFSNLNFTYHYHVILLLVGPEGGMTGKINDFKSKISLSFDFNEYKAKLENVKTTNTGSITLTFDGEGILDVVVNLLSEFVTTILHPLLTGIIEGMMKKVCNSVVDDVNNLIDQILNRNATNVTETLIGQKYFVPALERLLLV